MAKKIIKLIQKSKVLRNLLDAFGLQGLIEDLTAVDETSNEPFDKAEDYIKSGVWSNCEDMRLSVSSIFEVILNNNVPKKLFETVSRELSQISISEDVEELRSNLIRFINKLRFLNEISN